MSRHRGDDRPPRASARSVPGQATPAASPGQPGILPAHPTQAAAHRRSKLAGRQPSAEPPGRRSRVPGPSAIAHARAARWADRDERARDRRGAAGPDPCTTQSRSARSGGGSSRLILPRIGSRSSRRPNRADDGLLSTLIHIHGLVQFPPLPHSRGVAPAVPSVGDVCGAPAVPWPAAGDIAREGQVPGDRQGIQ